MTDHFSNSKKTHLKPLKSRTNKTAYSRVKVSSKTKEPTKIILFNKPFNTLTQFTGEITDSTLADFISIKNIYAAGRLDKDSEGLLVLTNDGILQARITQPKSKSAKIYWVQVEGIPSEDKLKQLRSGIELKDGMTLEAKVCVIDEPDIWPRHPPIRYRPSIATSWLSITLFEGRNRQVRRMTAAIGHPTLRLIRYKIGNWSIDGLAPGQWKDVSPGS